MEQTQSNRQQEVFELTQAREALLNRKAELVSGMREWKSEVWATLSEGARWATLERTEKSFAALEGRSPLTIRPLSQDIVKFFVRNQSRAPDGLLDVRNGKAVEIQIYRKLVLETEPDRAMYAYFHEEHHIEQLQAVHQSESRPDFSSQKVQTWRASLKQMMLCEGVVTYEQYRDFAHEQTSRLEAARLYARCVSCLTTPNKLPEGSQHSSGSVDPKVLRGIRRQEALEALTRLVRPSKGHALDRSREPER